MAPELPTDSALDAAEPTPIAQLAPDLSDPESRVIDGVVTITWPYSIVTKSVAFIVAEPDFRLRNAKGQVRVEFHGAAGQRLSKSGIGGGDEVRICLAGAKWEAHQAQTRMAGTMLEWQIKFETTLRLRVRRADSQEVEFISLDSASSEEVIPDVTELPELSSPVEVSNIFSPDYETATPLPKSPVHSLHAKRPAPTNLDANEYASPAYLKRARVSYGALFEDGLDIFDEKPSKKKKKKRQSLFSMGGAGWRYSSRSPSPVPDESPEPESDGVESSEEDQQQEQQRQSKDASLVPSPQIPMVDEGCQTQDLDFSPSMAVQVSAETRTAGPLHLSSPTPAGEPATSLQSIDAIVGEPSAPENALHADHGIGFQFGALPPNPFNTARSLFGQASNAPVADSIFSVNPPATSHAEPETINAPVDSSFHFEPSTGHFGSNHHALPNPFQPVNHSGLPTADSHWQSLPMAENHDHSYSGHIHQPVEISDSPTLEKTSPSIAAPFHSQGWQPQGPRLAQRETEEQNQFADEDGEGESEPDETLQSTKHHLSSGGQEEPNRIHEDSEDDEAVSNEEREPTDQYESVSEHPSAADSEDDEADEDEHEPTDYELRERERLRRLREGYYDEDDEEEGYDDEEEEEEEEYDEEPRFEDDSDQESGGEYESEEEPPQRPPQRVQPQSEPVFISLLSDSEDDAPAPAPAAPPPAPAPAPISTQQKSPSVEGEESDDASGDERKSERAEADQYDMEEESEEDDVEQYEEAADEAAGDQISDENSDVQVDHVDQKHEDEDDEMPSAAESEEAESEPEDLPHVVPDRMEVDEPEEVEPEEVNETEEADEPKEADKLTEELSKAPDHTPEDVVEDADEVMSQAEMADFVEMADEEPAPEVPEQDAALPADYEVPLTRSQDADVEKPTDQQAKGPEASDEKLAAETIAEDVGESDYQPPTTRSHDAPAVTEPEDEVAASKPPESQGEEAPVQLNQDQEMTDYEPPTTRSHDVPGEPEKEQTEDRPDSRSEEPAVAESVETEPETEEQPQSQTKQTEVRDTVEESFTQTQTQREVNDDVDEDDIAAQEQLMGDFLQTQTSSQRTQTTKSHQRKRSDTVPEPPRTRSQSKIEEQEAAEPEFTITASSLRSHRKSRSISTAAGDRPRDPSLALAKHKDEQESAMEPKSTEEPPSRPIRVTRSKADHADPSLALAKAPEDSSQASSSSRPALRVTRSMADIAEAGIKEGIADEEELQEEQHLLRSTQRTATPETVATPTPSTPTLRRRPAATPDSPAEVLKSPSVAESAADTENTSAHALKLQLQKDLRKTLPDNLPLKSLRNSLNKTADIMAIATTTPSPPYRPKNGPRDYMLEVLVTDPSAAPVGVYVAHIFRPHAASLPTVQAGDVVLLRAVNVVSVKDRGFGVRVGDASAWAVFEKADEEMLPQIKGPPVEVSDAEVQYAEGLRKWWSLLDGKALEKIERASLKLTAAGKEDKVK